MQLPHLDSKRYQKTSNFKDEVFFSSLVFCVTCTCIGSSFSSGPAGCKIRGFKYIIKLLGFCFIGDDCIAGYALSQVIFASMQSEIYLETLTSIWKMVRYCWPSVNCLAFRPENPPPPIPFCGNPPPLWNVKKWWSDSLTVFHHLPSVLPALALAAAPAAAPPAAK